MSSIRPMAQQNGFSLNVAQFAKRAGAVLAVVLCAFAFVVMAATASDPALMKEEPPAAAAPAAPETPTGLPAATTEAI